MMKKVTYLLSILTLMVFMSCSCEKEDPIVPSNELTLEKLQGEWVSTLYKYENTFYSVCSDFTNTTLEDKVLMLIILNIEGNCDINDKCDNNVGTNGMSISYDSVNDLIELDGGTYTFLVLDYDDVNGTLELELIEEYVAHVETGGIYTLEKQLK